MKIKPITLHQEITLRMDIERYLMGQTRLIDIAKERKVSMYIVQKLQNKIINERMPRV